jgi:hypothetical protein
MVMTVCRPRRHTVTHFPEFFSGFSGFSLTSPTPQVLLFIFVWLPAQLLRAMVPGFGGYHLRTFYLAPQLQIPVELILFHLAMLTFLERSGPGSGRTHLSCPPLVWRQAERY